MADTALDVKKGFISALQDNLGSQGAAYLADRYVQEVSKACEAFENDINSFKGYATDPKMLKGDIAEFEIADSFNAKAVADHSKFRVEVNRSHVFASEDISASWGEGFGLKFYQNAKATAKAQSISYKEYENHYGTTHETINENASIYANQTRLNPADQQEDIDAIYKLKFAKEACTRPEQAQRYKEALDHSQTKIIAPDGTESDELTIKDAEKIAKEAKEGKFKASERGFSKEQLIGAKQILSEGLHAGINAAIITLVLKLAPEIWEMLLKLHKEGAINIDDFKELGFAAIDASKQGFIRGFISASVVTACHSGHLGASLVNVSSGVVAAITVLVIETFNDSILICKGQLSKQEMAWHLTRNTLVIGCGVGGGMLAQVLVGKVVGKISGATLQAVAPWLPFAYMLGNFVGTIVGSFVFSMSDKAFMSISLETGFAFWGLVDQDYTLPDEVIKNLGIDIFEYEQYFPEIVNFDTYTPEYYQIDTYESEMIHILRRGVVEVHKIGYIYN